MQVNNVNTEMDYLKKVFNERKIREVDANTAGIKNINLELEILKMDVQNCPSKNDILKLSA